MENLKSEDGVEKFKEALPMRITHVENVQKMSARLVDDQTCVSFNFLLVKYFLFSRMKDDDNFSEGP